MFNRETFFEVVRSDPFGGSLLQDQVDGMNYILDTWEDAPPTEICDGWPMHSPRPITKQVTTVMFTSMWMNGSMSLKRPAKTS